MIFQSPLPIRGETSAPGTRPARPANFNPLSPYGERPICSLSITCSCYFNPLSPYGERLDGDVPHLRGFRISIPSPHTGRDHTIPVFVFVLQRFQSPLPIRGETPRRRSYIVPFSISIPSPHTGRDPADSDPLAQTVNFNPLSPYGERHDCALCGLYREVYFNPLSPYGERQNSFLSFRVRNNFNPLSPYGERLYQIGKKNIV